MGMDLEVDELEDALPQPPDASAVSQPPARVGCRVWGVGCGVWGVRCGV